MTINELLLKFFSLNLFSAFLLQINEERSLYWKERYVKESEMYEAQIRQLRNEIETRRSVLEDLKREVCLNFIEQNHPRNE